MSVTPSGIALNQAAGLATIRRRERHRLQARRVRWSLRIVSGLLRRCDHVHPSRLCTVGQVFGITTFQDVSGYVRGGALNRDTVLNHLILNIHAVNPPPPPPPGAARRKALCCRRVLWVIAVRALRSQATAIKS